MPVEDRYAQNGDVTIHYVASGKGPLVVMIHGYPDYSGSWDQLTPVLNDSYRVAALDTRGYNLSSQPEGVENYEMPKLIADVDAVIKAEGYEKATVIGHDWGGSIAWMFAFYYPQRLDNLIVLSTPHPEPVHARDADQSGAAGKLAVRAQLPAAGLRSEHDGGAPRARACRIRRCTRSMSRRSSARALPR